MSPSSALAIARPGALPVESLGARPSPRTEGDDDRALLEQALGRQYQVVRLIGRGGMGSVFLVRDTALHRVVAVKVLRAERMGNAEERERFRREARLAAQLAHPNIVPVHAFGESPTAMFMIMRYVAGESLGQTLARQGRLHPDDARRLLAELALALEYAHRQGVVHRDLKPENILLDGEERRAMVADFGVAMLRMSDPVVGEIRRSFGTPHFMSPEQAAGEPDLDGRSDIYALGVLGYLMLGGVLPFAGSDGFIGVAARRFADDRPPLRALAPHAPRDLVETIERCMKPSPDDRFRHARDLHAALTGRRPWWRRWVSG